MLGIKPHHKAPVDQFADEPPKRSKLPELLRSWCSDSRKHGIAAVVVTVPDPKDPLLSGRRIAGAYPVQVLEALQGWDAAAVASNDSMGRTTESLFGGTRLAAHGLHSWACWRAPLPFGTGRGMEVFLFSEQAELPRTAVFEVAWEASQMSVSLWRAAADAVIHITERERTCLQDAVLGKTAQETAENLGVEVATVAYHLANAYKKLRGKGKTNAAMRALHLGCLGRIG